MNGLITLYKIEHFLYKKKCIIIPRMIQFLIRMIYSCELPPSVEIGKGTLFIHNGLGCVVHPKAIIGDNCRVYQNVTIGGRQNRGVPKIGNNVFIGAGACVLGGVNIEDNVKVGANAVVINDIKLGGGAVGIPAKIIKYE